jgi:hypothetical protein
MIEIDKRLALHILEYLEYRINNTDHGYEWREACGLHEELMDILEVKNGVEKVDEIVPWNANL